MLLAYAQEVCAYWRRQVWRGREARLNRFAQFKTTIDGLGIHFVHVRSPHADALPLVMTHGWPDSIVEFHKVIEPLTNPTAHSGDAPDAFHLVCPSRRWAEKRFARLVYFNELENGGHFAAFEQPEVFMREVRACFRGMR